MRLSTLPHNLRNGLLVGVLVGLVGVLAVRNRPEAGVDRPERSAAAGASALLERLELAAFDAFAARRAQRVASSPDLVVAAIDGEAVARARERMGSWPWTRPALGALVQEFRDLGARLVVADLALVDPAADPGADMLLAQSIERAGEVVLGFDFAEVPEESWPSLGRWAFLQGTFATRRAALLACAPLLARGAQPYLLDTESRVEVWLGGFADRDAALQAARAATPARDSDREAARDRPPREPQARELRAEQALHRVTKEALFVERAAIGVEGEVTHDLRLAVRSLRPAVPALLATAASFGSVDVEPDLDGAVRSVRHLVKHEGRYYPSLALAAALRLEGAKEVSLARGRLQVGARQIPIGADGYSLLARASRPSARPEARRRAFAEVEIQAVAKSLVRRELGRGPDRGLEQQLKGKIVLLVSRLDPRASARGAAHALALDNLVRGDGMRRAGSEFDAAMAFALTLLGALLSVLAGRTSRIGRTLLLEALLAATALVLFLVWAGRWHDAGLWVATAVPALGFLTALIVASAVNLTDEWRAAQAVRELLGRGTSTAVIDAVLKRPRQLSVAGDSRVVTACCVELAGLGAASARLEPRATVQLLREFFSEASAAAEPSGGQVVRFTGERVAAFWGAPLPNARHAVDACRFALELRDRFLRLRGKWKERHGLELGLRIGLESGDAIIGDAGPQGPRGRANYTAVGPPVNLAEQLAALGRHFGVMIVAGEQTFEAVRGEVEVRELDLRRVPGRERPMRIFELLAVRGAMPAERHARVLRFEQALVAFRRREFAAAAEALERLRTEDPQDAAVRIYLERCRRLAAAPPDEGWDGVFDTRSG